MYWPLPQNGWLFPGAALNVTQFIGQTQQQPWYVVAIDDSVNKTLLGTKPKVDAFTGNSIASALSLASANISIANGMLGTLDTRFFTDIDPRELISMAANNSTSSATALNFSDPASFVRLINPKMKLQAVPWFDITSGTSSESLDETISNKIKDAIAALALVDKSILLQTNQDQNKSAIYYYDVGKIIAKIPHGGIYFQTVNPAEKKLKVVLSTGRDIRVDRAAGFPPQGFRQVLQMSQLTNAFSASF